MGVAFFAAPLPAFAPVLAVALGLGLVTVVVPPPGWAVVSASASSCAASCCTVGPVSVCPTGVCVASSSDSCWVEPSAVNAALIVVSLQIVAPLCFCSMVVTAL